MGLYTTLPVDLVEVDVIIAGGGAAGCVIASRLAASLPALSILLIEGGTNNTDISVSVPILFFVHAFDPASTTVTRYTTSTEPQLAGRQLSVISGSVLGGGSSVNTMIYSRGLKREWDDLNMDGWRAADMLPYLQKIETYFGPGDMSTHGSSGPIHISKGAYDPERGYTQFLTAAESLGIPVVDDIHDLKTAHGVQRGLANISPSGVRQDSASRYLHPLLEGGQCPNLHVLLEHQVVRVLFDGTRAVGVEFAPSPRLHPDTSPVSSGRSVRAKKMVIITCGALGTPLVLERSGIGSKRVLNRAGVPLVTELSSVGEGCHDHSMVWYDYQSALGLDETVNEAGLNPELIGRWVQEKHPKSGWNGIGASYKVRPDDKEVASLGPDFQHHWNQNFVHGAPRPLTQGFFFLGSGNNMSVEPNNVMTGNYISYPESRGHMHITGPNLDNPIDFRYGMLSDPKGLDLKAHVWQYKKQREIMRRMPVYRGEVSASHPRFPASSAAACVDLLAIASASDGGPSPRRVEGNIVYTPEDDKAIEQFVRENIVHAMHPLGGCKMAAQNRGGVVDGKLSVYGVQGLKIADNSILGSSVAAHTHMTALAVGERAADILIRELGSP